MIFQLCLRCGRIGVMKSILNEYEWLAMWKIARVPLLERERRSSATKFQWKRKKIVDDMATWIEFRFIFQRKKWIFLHFRCKLMFYSCNWKWTEKNTQIQRRWDFSSVQRHRSWQMYTIVSIKIILCIHRSISVSQSICRHNSSPMFNSTRRRIEYE